MSTCYFCGDVDAEVVITVGEWSVLRCPKCDLGWLYPKPDPSELSRLYDEDYFSQNRIMVAETDEQLALKVAGQRTRVRFVRRYKDSGELLDIGCASGYFLARAKEAGYSVCGLEVSEWAVREGREKLRLKIEQGTIETADFEPAAFDAITMWHTVEHFEDPVKSLSKVRRWLKPDGILIIECPNSRSFDAAKYGIEWTGWSIPYHLWHFTPRSLGDILHRLGYEVVGIQTFRSQWVKDRLRKIPVLSLARNLISSCFTGRDMRIVAKPTAGDSQI